MKRNVKRILKNPFMLFHTLGHRGFFNWMNDTTYLRIAYRVRMGKSLNLENPQTLNEKLQWLKLNDHRPEYVDMVDKYESKKYIESKLGYNLAIPTLGVWNHFDEIDFDKLPEKLVLKCTHDSGGLAICTDKNTFDREKAKEKIEKCLKHNYYWGSREWAYKGVNPRIIAEPYMLDESGVELKDYKIFCFNGVPDYVEVDFNRLIEHKLNPYNFDWNPLNFCDDSPNDYEANIPKPKRLEEMREIAAKLSSGYPFMRVDFYSIHDEIYIGELTLQPGSGYIQFNPKDRDLFYGQKLTLPKK